MSNFKISVTRCTYDMDSGCVKCGGVGPSRSHSCVLELSRSLPILGICFEFTFCNHLDHSIGVIGVIRVIGVIGVLPKNY